MRRTGGSHQNANSVASSFLSFLSFPLFSLSFLFIYVSGWSSFVEGSSSQKERKERNNNFQQERSQRGSGSSDLHSNISFLNSTVAFLSAGFRHANAIQRPAPATGTLKRPSPSSSRGLICIQHPSEQHRINYRHFFVRGGGGGGGGGGN